MGKRIDELDFLKFVFIILMITFHLVYIGESYPYVKQVVYTFHIPAFFIISGYVMTVNKPIIGFLKNILWLFVPYFIMESCYVFMASMLPIREHLESLSLAIFIDKIFMNPIGPYWYLHSLILCSFVYYLSFWGSNNNLMFIPRLITASVFLGFLSLYWEVISLSSIFYFFMGVSIKQLKVEFKSFFKSSWFAILGFFILACFPSNLDRFTIGGVLITYLVISSLLAVYNILPRFLTRFFNYIGRHTLVLLLFSPIFTNLVKPLVKVFSFETTGLLFLVVALVVNVSGCFIIGLIMDYIGMSKIFFGKERIMEPIR